MMNPSSPTLEDLLRGCHDRQPAAQQILYKRYYAFVNNIALHYGKNDAETQEIVQDTFLKLFVSLDREQFNGAFTKYLRRIVVNAGIDYYRKYHRSRNLLLQLLDFGGPSVSNLAIDRLEEEDIHLLLRQLSPVARLVFNLYDVEGFTHAEIAVRLNISEGTSRSNLAKARKKLRKLVGPFFNPSIVLSNV